MRQSFLLAWRTLVRGRVLAVLLAAAILDHLLLPSLIRSNGTADGWREMFMCVVPGSVHLFICIALVSCACGLFAVDRDGHRLSLTLVRGVSAFSVAFGKWLALCAVGAIVLFANAAFTQVRMMDAPPCRHHLRPAMPPAAVVAESLLEDYLKDPKTPERVRKAPRSEVLSLLANKEIDRYDVIAPGATVRWPFPADAARPGAVVRVRFATAFELRAPLVGRFEFGQYSAAVSNSTQSVTDLPLLLSDVAGAKGASPAAAAEEEGLAFTNEGTENVMLRPRRDLEIMNMADSFSLNLLRATLQMLSTVALLSAFGLFLSSALSRPVSIFTALVVMAVAMMAPSVVEQYPEELGATAADRMGLWFSRTVQSLTASATAASPVSDLAAGKCVELRDLAASVVRDALAVPCAFLALAAFIARRRPLSDCT